MWYSKDTNINELKQKLYEVGLLNTYSPIVPSRVAVNASVLRSMHLKRMIKGYDFTEIYFIGSVYDRPSKINIEINDNPLTLNKLVNIICLNIATQDKVIHYLKNKNGDIWVFHYGTPSLLSTAINDEYEQKRG